MLSLELQSNDMSWMIEKETVSEMLGCNSILKRLVARKQLHNTVMLHGSLRTQRKAACNMQPVTFCPQLGGLARQLWWETDGLGHSTAVSVYHHITPELAYQRLQLFP
jgi:hypothetical protein